MGDRLAPPTRRLVLNTPRVVSPDRAIWIPAGTWHEHRFFGHSAFHSVGFPSSTAPLPGQQPTVVSAAGLVGNLVIACTETGLLTAERRRVRAVLLDRLRRVPIAPLSVPRAEDDRLARACELVTQNLTRPRSLEWLARAVQTSDRTLRRLFKDEFGITYPQ